MLAHQQLLARLLPLLQAQGFEIGTGQYLRLQTLLQTLPPDAPLEALKTQLAPIFATSRAQQQLFYELFEKAMPKIAADVLTAAAASKSLPENPPNKHKKWRIALIALSLIVLMALLFWWLNPTAPPPLPPDAITTNDTLKTDTFITETNNATLTPTPETALPDPSELPTRSLPIVRDLSELEVPLAPAWVEAYYDFEDAWDDSFYVYGIFLLIAVAFFYFFYKKIKNKLAERLTFTLKIPYKINFAFYKNQLLKKAKTDAAAALAQLQKDILPNTEKEFVLNNLKDTFLFNPTAANRKVNFQQNVQQSQPFEVENADNLKKELLVFIENLAPTELNAEALQTAWTLESRRLAAVLAAAVVLILADLAWLLVDIFHLKMVVLALLAAVFWAIAQYAARQRKIIVDKLTSPDLPPFVWHIEVPHKANVRYTETFYGVLNRVRQRTADQFFRLNLNETVKATIAAAGQAQFRYTQQTRPPEYLLLIDRDRAENHRAALFNFLFEAFKGNDIYAERFYFDGDPRLLFNESYPDGVPLGEVQQRFLGSRLLIFSNGYTLLSSFSGKLARWTGVFGAWKERVLLTPETPAAWGRRERTLAQQFILLPASMLGLQRLIETLEADEPADVTAWKRIAAQSDDRIVLQGDLLDTLQLHFDENTLRWVAACAVYPTLHWDLTLALGHLLSERYVLKDFLNIENLLLINHLEWFSEGKIAPQARLELIAWLEKNDPQWLAAVRAYLHGLLQHNPPPKNSLAYEDYQMNVVVNEMQLTDDPARRRALEEQFRKLVEAGIAPDFTVLKYLDRPQTPLDVLVPKALRQYVFTDGKPFLKRKAAFWLVPLWCVLALVVLIWQPPLPTCAGDVEVFEERVLCIEDLADEVLLHEFATIAAIQQKEYALADSLIGIVTAQIAARSPSDTATFSFFKNVATAYYNAGVPHHNAQPNSDSACWHFQQAADLDSTVQLFRDLAAACPDPFAALMVQIPSGTFEMGSTEYEREQPVHTVRISSFYMSKYEVTQKLWREVMGSDPEELRFKGCDDCPVESVSWNDVQEFIKTLNQKTGKNYRLPTEAEWEYACRAGTTTPFNTGENLTTNQANYDGNYPYKKFPKGKYLEKTTAVGSYPPNVWGLYDMHGNVWEWCSDWYGSDYYKNSPSNNPKGPSSGAPRVLRGGSWRSCAGRCRSALRYFNAPDYRGNIYGFRLAL